VLKWLTDCDKAVQATRNADNDARSLVSYIECQLWERHEVDVMLWTPVQSEPREDRWRKPRKRNDSDTGRILRSDVFAKSPSDCVYDKPMDYLNLEGCLINTTGNGPKSGEKMNFFNTFGSKIYSIMGQRLGKKSSSTKSAMAKEQGPYSPFVMSGGRSDSDRKMSTQKSTDGALGQETKLALGQNNTTTRCRRRIRHY
jgi:hypothetical protein